MGPYAWMSCSTELFQNRSSSRRSKGEDGDITSTSKVTEQRQLFLMVTSLLTCTPPPLDRPCFLSKILSCSYLRDLNSWCPLAELFGEQLVCWRAPAITFSALCPEPCVLFKHLKKTRASHSRKVLRIYCHMKLAQTPLKQQALISPGFWGSGIWEQRNGLLQARSLSRGSGQAVSGGCSHARLGWSWKGYFQTRSLSCLAGGFSSSLADYHDEQLPGERGWSPGRHHSLGGSESQGKLRNLPGPHFIIWQVKDLDKL